MLQQMGLKANKWSLCDNVCIMRDGSEAWMSETDIGWPGLNPGPINFQPGNP